jgi:hypothetical protein
MKSLIILVFVLFSVNAFSQKDLNHYEIKGNIKNLSAKYVYLRIKKEAPDKHTYWPKVDSAKVMNGEFSLNGDSSIKIPSSAMIVYVDPATKKEKSLKFYNPSSKRNLENFIVENARIDVTGNLLSTTISGTKETVFFYNYNRLFYLFDLMPIQQKIDSLKRTKNTTALNLAVKEYESGAKKFKSDLKEIILKNRSTYGAVNVLSQNMNIFTSVELQDLLNLFDKKLLESPSAKMITTFIKYKKT